MTSTSPVSLSSLHPQRRVEGYPSIRLESLNGGKIIARRYRNRRIGEFLKELDLTEGRCTGIPKIRAAMERNGSPEPRFSTDEGRTHFLVELPVHPQFAGMLAQDEAHDQAHNEAHNEAERQLLAFIAESPRSRAEIAAQLGVSPRGRAVQRVLDRLVSEALAEMTIPDKLNSRNQKYRVTEKGRKRSKQL
jgi:ATP-dependent DNA helicase RecG